MSAQYLSDFELCVMLAIAKLEDNAYGVTIRETIEGSTRRSVSIGAIYVVLGRLAKKGYLVTSLSDPKPIRGGRARKLAVLTESGRRALTSSVEALHRMLDGVLISAPARSSL